MFVTTTMIFSTRRSPIPDTTRGVGDGTREPYDCRFEGLRTVSDGNRMKDESLLRAIREVPDYCPQGEYSWETVRQQASYQTPLWPDGGVVQAGSIIDSV